MDKSKMIVNTLLYSLKNNIEDWEFGKPVKNDSFIISDFLYNRKLKLCWYKTENKKHRKKSLSSLYTWDEKRFGTGEKYMDSKELPIDIGWWDRFKMARLVTRLYELDKDEQKRQEVIENNNLLKNYLDTNVSVKRESKLNDLLD